MVLLAAALLRARGGVVPYAAIAEAVWQPPAVPPVRHCQNIRQVASKLRLALADIGASEAVQSLREVGLCVVPSAAAQGHQEPAPVARVRDLSLDPLTGTVRHARQEVALGEQGAAILRALLSADGLVTRAGLLAAMYPDGQEPACADGALRVKLTQLRRRLRTLGAPVEIAATYGVGYRLRSTEPAMGEGAAAGSSGSLPRRSGEGAGPASAEHGACRAA